MFLYKNYSYKHKYNKCNSKDFEAFNYTKLKQE